MSKTTLITFLLLCSISFVFAAGAMSTPNSPIVNEQPADTVMATNKAGDPKKMAPPKTGSSSPVGWLSSFEFWMSFSVLCFGMLVFVIEIIMVKLTAFRPEQTIKLLAVTLIVISTLFIITAGFDSEQIAPAMGLFGTIAGYMLGRASGKSMEAQE